MRALTLLICLLLTTTLSAQGDGIVFHEKPFDELLALAKAEDKVIFLDAYTTWCGPCKMMTAKVFPREEVGAVYNERYINAKIDMEKGEGPDLAKRYDVQAYPTYLFIDGDGEIVHKGIGYIPAEQLLKLADVASGDENLKALNERYDAGDRDPAFVKSYLTTLGDVYESKRADVVLDEYLSGTEDWSDPATLKMILNNPGKIDGERFQYLLVNGDRAAEELGSGPLMMRLQQSLLMAYMEEAGERGLPSLEEADAYYEKNAASFQDRLKSHYAMFHAEQMRDMDSYVPAAKAYFAEYPSNDWSELNSVAWTFYESVDDQDDLKMALEWAKQSVAIDANYPNLDTLAWLHHKLGQHEEAEAAAHRAIAMAKETGQDYSETEGIFNK